jgi:DNA repair photolyase
MPQEIQSKTILNKSKRRDKWFLDDYTINPYSGCSFNCLYCYIRGSKYGIHMEDKLSVKTNAPELLEKRLNTLAKKEKYGIIVLSSATDPYLQIEKDYKLTRKLLEIILQYRFPIHIITKSDLVARDFDLLNKINQNAILPAELEGKLNHKAIVTFSFSTLDDKVAKIFEPGATPPAKRFDALKKSLDAGFHSGVSLMPLLPYVTDTGENLEYMFRKFSEAGVKYMFADSLTLFGEGAADSKTLVINTLRKHYPQFVEKYERFFGKYFSVPPPYRNALHRKIKELNVKYNIKDSIIG